MKTRILKPMLGAFLLTLLALGAAGQPAGPPPAVAAPSVPAGPAAAGAPSAEPPALPAPAAPAAGVREAPPLGLPVVHPSVKVEERSGAGLASRLPDNLDELVELAQRTSPEVIIAEAQLREAEARLRQARLEATQKAIQSYRDRKVVELARTNLKELQTKYEAGICSSQELLAGQERLAELEAALASSNAAYEMMAAERGASTKINIPPVAAPWVRVPRPPLSEEPDNAVHAALENPVSIEFQDESLSEVAQFISEYVAVNIVVDTAADRPVSIALKDVPLRDALLALSDAGQDICFVIRDYGIFATTQERAIYINAPTIPGTVPLCVPAEAAEGVGHRLPPVGGPFSAVLPSAEAPSLPAPADSVEGQGQRVPASGRYGAGRVSANLE
ncbi:MAG TPA: hypothetical protein PLM14_00560 [Candidatus Hydrogenedentes bacterium]|nr:hypothetical protein [Candidatus Hydrogenedentota bacterium]HQH53604.1 hypothetical protein [Candidatus Hydrogenedentota bacterium]